MGGIDVIMLRGICEVHTERNILPMIKEMQAAHGKLLEHVKVLEGRLVELTAASEQNENTQQTLHKQQELEELVRTKADASCVPTLEQFQEVAGKVDNFVCSSVAATDDDDKIKPLMEKLEELAAEVARKPDLKDVASVERLDDFSDILELKANVQDVPSRSDIQKLTGTLDRKAFSNKVPTLAQFLELREAVDAKVDARLVPTLAQVNELEAEVRRKNISAIAIEEVRKVTNELGRKANSADVPTMEQVESLMNNVIQPKLESMTSRKVDVDNVPTLTQYKEFAAVTERKLAFLANKVNKNDNSWDNTVWVPAMVDLGAWEQNTEAWAGWNSRYYVANPNQQAAKQGDARQQRSKADSPSRCSSQTSSTSASPHEEDAQCSPVAQECDGSA